DIKVKEVSREVIVIPLSETILRDSDEIAKEKKEILLDEVNNRGPGVDSVDRKIRGESEVYKTVVAYVGGLKYLYNNALRKAPSLKGKITVRMAIAANGRVTKAEIISSTLDSPELEEAIINRIYRWRFPELKNGEDYTIPYTFDFAPGG
ncbi:MAG: TonB family protein, partial [Thermodesulfobacteriota bacterium]